MKKVIYLLLIGGTILMCPYQSKAEPYYVTRSFDNNHQGISSGSKAPARPLCIDITAHVITVPEQLVGYTLTLSDGEESYTYYITGTTQSVPQEISGEYELTITNGNICYQGDIIF